MLRHEFFLPASRGLTSNPPCRHNAPAFTRRRDQCPNAVWRPIMPLLDHFHPPLSAERRWESFHSSWATRIADALTDRWLPPNFIAEEHAHFDPTVEIDVATFAQQGNAAREDERGAATTLSSKVWS